MVKLFNLVKVNTATTGTGDVTFGAAFSDAFFTPSEAGAVDGDSVSYVLVEGDDTEIGTGVIGSSVTTMTRTVLKSKIGGTAGTSKMNLGGAAYLAFTALADDFLKSIPPLGRLTLASGVPVMATSQAAKTTVYYTPYAGNMVPIYDGTNMVPTVFSELSQATTDATKSPAAVAATKIYDMFVWNDSGTIRCTRGPAWTNATTRGYTLTMVNGILLNTSSITNGPAASRGTWVGTIASNASSTIDFIFGTAGPVAGVLNVWNAYNRVSVGCTVIDIGASYTYSSSVFRQARGSSANQISFVVGASEDAISASYQNVVAMVAAANGVARIAVAYDSTTTAGNNSTSSGLAAQALYITPHVPFVVNAPAPGTHFIAALENSDGTNSHVFNVGGVVSTAGLSISIRM